MRFASGKRAMAAILSLAMFVPMLGGLAQATETRTLTVKGKTYFETVEMTTTESPREFELSSLVNKEKEMYVIDSKPPVDGVYSTKSLNKDYGPVFVQLISGDTIKITPIKAGSVTIYVSVAGMEPLFDDQIRVIHRTPFVAIPITVKEDGDTNGYIIINNKTKTDAVVIKTTESSKDVSITAMTTGNFLLVPQPATSSELKVSDVVYPANFVTDYTYFNAKLTQSSTGGTLSLTPKLSGTGAMKLYLCRTTEHGSLHVINKILDVFTLSVGVEFTGSMTEKLAINTATDIFGSAQIAARYGIPENTIQWFSNDITIATVQNGRIVGLRTGVTLVTAYLPSLNRMIEITVTVPITTTPVPTATPVPAVTPTPIPAATPTPAPSEKTKYKITASSLNIRSGPGTGYSKVGSVSRNKIVYGYLTDDGDWIRVKASENKGVVKKDGYVSSTYVMMP